MPIIIAGHAGFPGVREAAAAEASIDWWDESDRRRRVCTECFAAVELFDHLERLAATSVLREDVALASDADPLPADGRTVIMVGNADSNAAIRRLQEAEGVGLEADGARGEESFRMKGLRADGASRVVLSGGGRVGTLYGAYAFLELLGVRWYGPGERDTHYPPTTSLAHVGGIDITDAPGFRTRGCYSEYIDDSSLDLLLWMARNRINFAQFARITNPPLLKKLGISICGGGHEILYRFIAPDAPCGSADGRRVTNAEAHPEWYCLIGEKRSFRRDHAAARNGFYTGDNFCTTNPEAVDALCAGIVGECIAGTWSRVDCLSFWLLDNGGWCECDRCREAGNHSSRLIALVHALRQAIRASRAAGALKRDVRIMFPAYHETRMAPDRPLPDGFDYDACTATFFPIERCYAHGFDHPGCTETNTGLYAEYSAWAADPHRFYRGQVCVGEYYNVSDFASLPLPLCGIVGHDIPLYHRTGARHFYSMHFTSGCWGMNGVRNHLVSRLLWDPCAEAGSLRARYFMDMFGEAAPLMDACSAALERATANIKYLKHYQGAYGARYSLYKELAEGGSGLFRLLHMRMDGRAADSNAAISFTESISLLGECRSLMDKTMSLPLTGAVLPRAREQERSLSYAEDMLRFTYRVVRARLCGNAGRAEDQKRELAAAAVYAERLAHTSFPFLHAPYCLDFRNGLDASNIRETFQRLGEEATP